MLRTIRQRPDESVQMFSKRYIRLATDAFPTDQINVRNEVADIFYNAIYFDYLHIKLLREDPKLFGEALEIAIKEHNFRKRLNSRIESREDGRQAFIREIMPFDKPEQY